MLHLNEMIRKTNGNFSWKGLKATHYNPEWYGADSISDFLNNKDQIIPTGYRAFKTRNFRNQAIIQIPEVNFERVEPCTELLEEIRVIYDRFERKNDYPFSKKVKDELEFKVMELSGNARIFGVGNSMMIYCHENLDVPEQTLYNVGLSYNGVEQYCELIGFRTHGYPLAAKNKKKKFSFGSLLDDFSGNLTPQPAGIY